jgi:hypothetical protein
MASDMARRVYYAGTSRLECRSLLPWNDGFSTRGGRARVQAVESPPATGMRRVVAVPETWRAQPD